MTRLLRVLAFITSSAILCCGASACRSQRPAAEEPANQAIQRLQGRWLLVDFTPEMQLEPMLRDMLTAQFRNLSVDFHGVHMVATGPGVNTTRQYEVVAVRGDWIDVVIFDDGNLTYRVSAQFQEQELQFVSLDTPWRGRGTLRRIQ